MGLTNSINYQLHFVYAITPTRASSFLTITHFSSTTNQKKMSELLSASENFMDFLIKKGNGVKGLSHLNLKQIPEQFIQPLAERFENMKVSQECIPVIDVSNWDNPKVAQSICEAATKWGFFQIINHGIPINVIEDVIKCAHDFFELPVEERRKYLKHNSPTSTVVLKSSFSATVDKYMDWKDHLVHFVDQRHEQESRLWPPVSRDRVLNYVSWARPLIKKLLEVLMNGINVKKIDDEKEYSLMGMLVASLIYYPECPSPHLAVGSGRHSDVSSITLLLQDDIGGLYARPKGGDRWIHVAPMKGALIVNIGDALQIMSNGRYKSIEHRVFLTERKNRVSVPIFANALSNSVIGPLSEVLAAGEKPIYKQVVFSDYFNHFLSKGQDNKRAINFAKIAES